MIENYSPDARKMLYELASLIAYAENLHKHACLNSGTPAQVRASERIDDYRHAFAIASGTAVGGMHFNQLLEEVAFNGAAAYEPSIKIEPKEADGIRFKARGVYLGDDDIVILENAAVEKVEDGYWVDARVWIDA